MQSMHTSKSISTVVQGGAILELFKTQMAMSIIPQRF